MTLPPPYESGQDLLAESCRDRWAAQFGCEACAPGGTCVCGDCGRTWQIPPLAPSRAGHDWHDIDAGLRLHNPRAWLDSLRAPRPGEHESERPYAMRFGSSEAARIPPQTFDESATEYAFGVLWSRANKETR